MADLTQAQWAELAQIKATDPAATAYLQSLAAQDSPAGIANQQSWELQGIGGSGATGTAQGNGATSTASSLGQDAIAQVQAKYPNLAWMLNIPELGPLIVNAAQTGMDPAAFQAEFESTQWYQTKSDSVKNWLAEVETNPGQANADMQAQNASMNATLSAMGLTPTGAQLSLLSSQSLANGWTPQEIKDNIAENITANANGTFSFNYAGTSVTSSGAGTLTASVDQIQAEAGKYLVPISGSTAQSFATAIARGTMDITGVDAYLQQQAASLYPSIAGAIKSGVTPADYVTPYKEVAAQLLGVDPNSIDMTQQKWNRALSVPQQDGKPPVAMSLYAWQQTLMQDPQYGYLNSINAKDRASSIAQGLAETFGKSPSGPSGSTAFSAAGAPPISGVPIA